YYTTKIKNTTKLVCSAFKVFDRNIKFIGDRAFAGSSKLTTIKFSNDSELEAINISAFANTNLEKITLPNKLSFIASYAFANIKMINFQ
uniref:leucine-rich repeat protein n=1 Tax=Mycoplasmopsis bovis TaxID=28903 RepID=UPI003D2E2D2C